MSRYIRDTKGCGCSIIFSVIIIIVTLIIITDNSRRLFPDVYPNTYEIKQVYAKDTTLYLFGLESGSKSFVIIKQSVFDANYSQSYVFKIAEENTIKDVTKFLPLANGSWVVYGMKGSFWFWYLLDSTLSVKKFQYFYSQIADVVPVAKGFEVLFWVNARDKEFGGGDYVVNRYALVRYDTNGIEIGKYIFDNEDLGSNVKIIPDSSFPPRFYIDGKTLYEFNKTTGLYVGSELSSCFSLSYDYFYSNDTLCFLCGDSLILLDFRNLQKISMYLGDYKKVKCYDSVLLYLNGYEYTLKMKDLRTDKKLRFKLKKGKEIDDYLYYHGKIFIVGSIESENRCCQGACASYVVNFTQWDKFKQSFEQKNEEKVKPHTDKTQNKKAGEQHPSRIKKLLRFISPFYWFVQ